MCQFDEGQYLNAGAWRIPNADQGLLGYCAELGVRMELYVDATDANYFYDEDPALGPLAGKRVRLREVKADLWGSTTELLVKAMDQGQIDAPLTAEDTERLVQFLVRAGFLDSADHVYRPPASRGSQDPYDLSALLNSGFGARVRSLYAGPGGRLRCFSRGRHDADRVGVPASPGRHDHPGCRRCRRSARRRCRPCGVQGHQDRRGTGGDADYCVCCLPMSVLRGIDVNLSPEMIAAVNAVRPPSERQDGVADETALLGAG